jgi:hypothetical protein
LSFGEEKLRRSVPLPGPDLFPAEQAGLRQAVLDYKMTQARKCGRVPLGSRTADAPAWVKLVFRRPPTLPLGRLSSGSTRESAQVMNRVWGRCGVRAASR